MSQPSRRRRLWLGALALLLAGSCWTVVSIDRSAARFYESGREVATITAQMAEALQAGDLDRIALHHGEQFHGKALGLAELGKQPLVAEANGIRVQTLGWSSLAVRREKALQDWRRYRDGFDSVDEVRMFPIELESWSRDEVAAKVSLQLVGRPRDARTSVVDRAVLRFRFERYGDVLRLRRASTLKAERLFALRPHFAEVGANAGVDFENRYYPRFLSEPLRFGMLRYGPAGISAADYDGDGYYDLFIPDGVESRLFRNRRDGTFEEVTEPAGLSGLSGVSVGLFADYDNDGHADLFVSRTFEPNQLFHNNGDGTFTDVTERSGIGADCCTTVASWADYDLDGDLDLYVGRYLDPRERIPTTFYARNGEPNRLYRNDGDGRFTDVTDLAGVGEPGLCLGSVFGDYDDDGDPDLYVVNDFGRKTLYRNEGDGTFTDVTVETGTLAYGAGMSASFGDYDNDGDFDIYVAHIGSESAWFAEAPTVNLYILNMFRQGTFLTDLPLFFEMWRQGGSDVVGHFQQMASGNTLLRNGVTADGSRWFDDVSAEAGANPRGWYWGSSFADFDNDGWQDLYSANGWVYGPRGDELELEFLHGVVNDQRAYKAGDYFDPDQFEGRSWHGWQRNQYLRNQGDGTFRELGIVVGSGLELNSRGIAVADFENRGALDLAVAASTDRHALLRNEVALRRHWLALELRGAGTRLPMGSNRDAVGAKVTVTAGTLVQVREVVLGDGYGSQNALRLHFGLGSRDQVDEVVVRWPRSGDEQRFTGLDVDQILILEEGVAEPGRRPVGPISFPETDAESEG